MAAQDVYTIGTASVSDRPLANLLEELLLESSEAEPPRLCTDCTHPCDGGVTPTG